MVLLLLLSVTYVSAMFVMRYKYRIEVDTLGAKWKGVTLALVEQRVKWSVSAWFVLWVINALGVSLQRVQLPFWLTVVGELLVASGLFLFIMALRNINKSWRLGIDRRKPAPLVVNGVYRWTRNPIYVAFHLMFSGTILMYGDVLMMLVNALAVWSLHQLVLREERYLLERFSSVYEHYCATTPRYYFRKR